MLVWTPSTLAPGNIDGLPTEIILNIVQLLQPIWIVCLGLTNKRLFNLLIPGYLIELKSDWRIKKSFLQILERDLPWNYYACSRCWKLHFYKYEQGRCVKICSSSGPTPEDYQANEILWDNIRIARKKYLDTPTPPGSSRAEVSLTYSHEYHFRRVWGCITIRSGSDRKLYARCETWLRCDHDGWPQFPIWRIWRGKMRFCVHMREPYDRHLLQWKFWRDSWQVLQQESLEDLTKTGELYPGQRVLRPRHEFPDYWASTGLQTCNICRTETVAHYGFSSMLLEPIAPEPARPRRPGESFRFTIGERLKALIGAARQQDSSTSPPTYCTETSVITRWMCLGFKASEDDDDWVRHNPTLKAWHLPLHGYEPGHVKSEFDCEADKPYHPMYTLGTGLKPIPKRWLRMPHMPDPPPPPSTFLPAITLSADLTYPCES